MTQARDEGKKVAEDLAQARLETEELKKRADELKQQTEKLEQQTEELEQSSAHCWCLRSPKDDEDFKTLTVPPIAEKRWGL